MIYRLKVWICQLLGGHNYQTDYCDGPLRPGWPVCTFCGKTKPFSIEDLEAMACGLRKMAQVVAAMDKSGALMMKLKDGE